MHLFRIEDYMQTGDLENKVVLDADGNPIINLTATDVLANDLRNTNLTSDTESNKIF